MVCPAHQHMTLVMGGRCKLHHTTVLMGLRRLELPTSRLSGVRSNRLSYKPRLMSKCT